MRSISAFATRVVRALLDTVAAILGVYYSKKYAAIVRRLGLPLLPISKRRGFVIIQIDGLSHTHLQIAIERGYAPYMQRLLRRDEFTLHRWHPGLPCTTPAAQAGIMFGNNEDIPAFRWYDKETGEAIVCTVPGTVHALQERVSRGHRGILKGGSSFMNMFDGNASLSMFTLGAMNRKRFFESVRGLGFALLFALNPFRTAKTFILALWEYLTDLVQRTSATIRKRNPRPLERMFPFLRVIANVVFREMQTFAVLIDIYRGVPAIYTTYYGYDEVAHHYGPLSKPALRALHAVDARIRQIDSLRRLALTCEHDLYILSDHGMTSAVPFHLEHHQTLGEFVRDAVGDSVQLSEGLDTGRRDAFTTIYLGDELEAIEANVKPPLARIPHEMHKLVAERISLEEDTKKDLPHRTDLVVSSSGSISHIYFNVTPHQMSLGEVISLFPNLVDDLVNHPSIWLVIGREDDSVIVVSQGSVLTLGSGYRVKGNDPLAVLPAPRLTAKQLYRLARFPHSGDLILMGKYDPDEQVVSCFEKQWACHGGIGGAQEIAFMMTEKNADWNLDMIGQATEIHSLFMQRYGL